MQRELFSLTKIAADFIDVSAAAAQLEIDPEEVIRAAAVAIDEPYELSIDGQWHFAHPAIARIKASLA